MRKLIVITTVPASLKTSLRGQLKFLGQYFEVIAISSKGPDLTVVRDREKVKTYSLSLTRKITPLIDLLCLIKLFFILRKENPDIVYTHTPKAGTIGMLASYLANIPHRIHTVAGLPLMESTGIKKIILETVEKITYKVATIVYPNSFNLMKIIIERRFTSQDKLKVISHGSSNGIDINYFSRKSLDINICKALQRNLKINIHNFTFIYIGRIVKDKGIEELVTAFIKLYDINSAVRLLIIGYLEKNLDPISPLIENQINEHNGIIFEGRQNDIRNYLAISNVFILPSYREGFPNTVLEACAMDLPCIVTDINGSNEIIQNQFNGLVVPAKSSTKLFEAMINLLQNRFLCEELASKSRNSILKYEQNEFWSALVYEFQYKMSKRKNDFLIL